MLLSFVEGVAQTPGELAGSFLRVTPKTAILSLTRRGSVATSSRTAALTCTSARVQLFRDGFVRQPPSIAVVMRCSARGDLVANADLAVAEDIGAEATLVDERAEGARLPRPGRQALQVRAGLA
jgi:hypothetical protein